MTGRVVALHLPPDRFLDRLRQVWDAGDAALPLPLDAPEDRIRQLLDLCRPHELVTEPRQGATLDRTSFGAARSVPDGTALVVTTSGSTGDPKGVLLSHRALEASTSASVRRLGAGPGDRFVLALPLHHVAGLQVVLRAWACGTEPLHLADAGDPAELAATPGDHVSLVPTQLLRLVESHERGVLPADALRRWRTILVGGAHLDPELRDRAAAAGANVVTSYGMTETCGGCVYDGIPLEGVEVALRHDGLIRLRGPMLFSGYLDEPDESDEPGGPVGGWFTTGDVGEMRNGRLVVLGRHDDVIVSGGENVPARAVAAVLAEYPELADVEVVGVPDAEWGERVVAVAVARDPTSPPDLDQLRRFVQRRLPASFAPRQLVLVAELPRDGLGKPTVAELRRVVEAAPR